MEGLVELRVDDVMEMAGYLSSEQDNMSCWREVEGKTTSHRLEWEGANLSENSSEFLKVAET